MAKIKKKMEKKICEIDYNSSNKMVFNRWWRKIMIQGVCTFPFCQALAWLGCLLYSQVSCALVSVGQSRCFETAENIFIQWSHFSPRLYRLLQLLLNSMRLCILHISLSIIVLYVNQWSPLFQRRPTAVMKLKVTESSCLKAPLFYSKFL